MSCLTQSKKRRKTGPARDARLRIESFSLCGKAAAVAVLRMCVAQGKLEFILITVEKLAYLECTHSLSTKLQKPSRVR